MKIPRLLLVACAGLALVVPTWTHAAAAPLVPVVARASRPPIVVIVLENKEYGSIVGSSSAHWLNHTFIRRGTLFTGYHATHHPSLPNYLAMTSGTTSGCHDNECPRKTYTTDNLFRQLSRAGIGWVAWMESMPSRCSMHTTSLYAARHNPPLYYKNLFPKICAAKDRRYPRQLPRQLRPFTYVVPNICHDMHDCSVAVGDRWLRAHVPPLLEARGGGDHHLRRRLEQPRGRRARDDGDRGTTRGARCRATAIASTTTACSRGSSGGSGVPACITPRPPDRFPSDGLSSDLRQRRCAMRLVDKVALITGGTSGIGAATARLFAQEGARVVITGRSADRGAEVVSSIGDAGRFVSADVRLADDCRRSVDETIEAFGRIDVLFNNAGRLRGERHDRLLRGRVGRCRSTRASRARS